MNRHFLFSLFTCWCIITSILTGSAASEEQGSPVKGRTFYVRQTVGDDNNDGLSPKAAWRHVSKLSGAMQAGDTAYVGPGLYREEITVLHDGTSDKRIVFIADTTGQHTGDPPGVVMITGAEPLDTSIFVPQGLPGVYKAPFLTRVWGVVEMDGDQFRYWGVKSRKEVPLPAEVSEIDLVAKQPSSYFYHEEAKILYIHTSDGKPPSRHEMEYMKRGNGIGMYNKHYITIIGFTFRHMGDAGINFFKESSDGIAINNISYGNRQGIRVYTAKNITVYGNTLFRNENCGIYYAAQSTNGIIIGNTMYENIKGIRWSSQSANGLAFDNILFDNHEAGISVEKADHTILGHNKLVNNKKYQLLVWQSDYTSEDNCFEKGSTDQLITDFFVVDRYKTLADYQKAKNQDLSSREGGCGPLPKKIDVRKLHEETMAYTERARKILMESLEKGIQEIKSTNSPKSGSETLKQN